MITKQVNVHADARTHAQRAHVHTHTQLWCYFWLSFLQKMNGPFCFGGSAVYPAVYCIKSALAKQISYSKHVSAYPCLNILFSAQHNIFFLLIYYLSLHTRISTL